MKKLFTGMVCTIFALSVQAQKAYESFNYEVGDFNVAEGDESNGWSSGWSQNEIIAQITNEPVVYNDTYFVEGNAATLRGNEWGCMQRSLTEEAWINDLDKVYWFSGLQNLLTDPYPKEQYGGFAIYGTNNSKKLYMGLQWTGSDGTGNYVVEVNSYKEQHVGDVVITPNVAVWYVAKLVMSGDASSPCEIYVWINPDPKAGEPKEEDAYYYSANQDFGSGLVKIEMNCHNGIDVQYDEVALGTSWDDVNVFNATDIDKTLASGLTLNCMPNPVSSVAQISYQLPKDQNVKISVYNMLGNEVSVLLNENQVTGSHYATLSAQGLSDGIYLCKLQAGNEVSVKQILIQK